MCTGLWLARLFVSFRFFPPRSIVEDFFSVVGHKLTPTSVHIDGKVESSVGKWYNTCYTFMKRRLFGMREREEKNPILFLFGVARLILIQCGSSLFSIFSFASK